jgi:hypothetical protein
MISTIRIGGPSAFAIAVVGDTALIANPSARAHIPSRTIMIKKMRNLAGSGLKFTLQYKIEP